MQTKLTDDQLDKLLQTVIADASADEAMINEVAASPNLWWNVQRRIDKQKQERRAPWPPVVKVWRWLMIGVPAAAAVVLAITFYLLPPTEMPNLEQAAVSHIPALQELATIDPSEFSVVQPNSGQPERSDSRSQRVTKRKSWIKREAARKVAVAAEKKEEIKSEFIALSYARDPESGQIVRVRVPSSMMVTVGLVASVEKPSALIDAEVIVGDDGLTRAIRFIH